MKYYIGIDGGGTKTAYALFNENKEQLAEVTTEGTNHENLEGSYDAAAETLLMGMRRLLGTLYLDINDVEAVLMGLAGMDHPYQINIMKRKLKERGMLCKTYIFNDGYIITKAGTPDGVGIGFNCGTGTCCNSIGSTGKLLQIGGFGDYSGDAGNGHWIAGKVWRMIYDDVCVGSIKTAMTEDFFIKFNIDNNREFFLNTIIKLENEESEDFIRGLIDIYFDELNKGDEGARIICEQMSRRGAEFIAAHFRHNTFNEGPVTVVLSGSIHTKLPCDKYLQRLKKLAVEMTGRELNFVKLKVSPVVGCINWLLDGTLEKYENT